MNDVLMNDALLMIGCLMIGAGGVLVWMGVADLLADRRTRRKQ